MPTRLQPGGLQGGPGLELRGVEKRFRDVYALRDVDLTVGQGEFVSLLGPSGCGKTTTLRIVAGLEEATAGQVLLDGKNIGSLPPYRRPVNTVFQNYALFPHLTVWENVAFGLRLKSVPAARLREHVNEYLHLVGLGNYAWRRPGELSGGQQQRVALARALINDPKILLLDEPLGALDLQLRKQMQIELRRIQRQTGNTFIYVTHDQEEAILMSDRIAVMKDGRIRQIGTPVEVYRRPMDAFVASFVGESNLLSGKCLQEARGVVMIDGCSTVMPIAAGVVGDTTLFCVRPEVLRVEAQPRPGFALSGTVRDIFFVGDKFKVYVRVVGQYQDEYLAYVQNPSGIATGAAVFLSWDAEAIMPLRPEPGEHSG